tara:strand:- start:279 stop:698 length:420 start_codon:yes stop_codon:yes gene_type:complete
MTASISSTTAEVAALKRSAAAAEAQDQADLSAELDILRDELAKLRAARQREMAESPRKRGRADDGEDFDPPPPPADEVSPLHEVPRGANCRRSSVEPPPSEMAVPVLQSRLRAKLGQSAKLPRKKAELIALYKKKILNE